MKYYHVTSFLNMIKINDEGLKANNDGYIFVINTIDLANYIAVGQLFMEDYALFEVNVDGLLLEKDIVGELGSKFQFKIKTDLIDTSRINNLGMFKASKEEYQRTVEAMLYS